MADTTTSPIVGDHTHGVHHSDRGYDNQYGRAADHQAYEAITSAKDVVMHVDRVGGLVTDNSFRMLEQFGISGVQATKNAGDLGIQAEKLAAASTVQVALVSAAAAMQAEKLASAQALAASECCCEMKALITAEGAKTRDLIGEISRSALAVQLVDTKIELSNQQQDARFRAMLVSAGLKVA